MVGQSVAKGGRIDVAKWFPTFHMGAHHTFSERRLPLSYTHPSWKLSSGSYASYSRLKE